MKLSVFYANVRDAAEKSGKSIAAVLEKIKCAGITALDFDYADIKDGFPDEFSASGMGVNSIYAFFDYSEDGVFEQAKRVTDLAAECGAVAMFVPKILPKEEIEELKKLNKKEDVFLWLDGNEKTVKTAETLERLSVYGLSRNVLSAVENFDSHRSLTERKAEIEWLFGKAPHLGFNPDTGNSATCGEDIRELCACFRDRVVNVHCKERTKDLKTAAVGAGEMPVAEIVKELTETGYDGGFAVEVFGVENPLDAIIESANYLKNLKAF